MKLTNRLTALLLAALMLVTVFSFTACFGKKEEETEKKATAKTVVKDYCSCMKNYKYDKLLDLLPDAYIEYFLEDYDLTEKELSSALKELSADRKEQAKDMEREVVDFTLGDTRDVDEDELEYLNDYYDSANLDIKSAKKVPVELTISRSGDETTERETYTAIKVDGKWYLAPVEAAYILRAAAEEYGSAASEH
ncbi:MAG: hypothetical protein IK064_02130 [Clostridia bacterium]|nr:hypothetical protein [Clostridia bacterium]MBR6006406.1 hypothetical protein [Clostridia bacterium]